MSLIGDLAQQYADSLEVFTVTSIVGDLEIPCDYAGEPSGVCPDEPAEWVLFLVRCSCGAGGTRLACNTCAEFRMASEDCVECYNCGELTVPARLAYSYIEHLNKPYA